MLPQPLDVLDELVIVLFSRQGRRRLPVTLLWAPPATSFVSADGCERYISPEPVALGLEWTARMLVSIHNHTRWSDGSASVAASVEVAGQMGINELGISDHYTVAPDGAALAWSMPLDRLPAYVREVQTVAATSRSLTLRLGLEADFFPETVEELRRRLAAHPFDYIIGSVHFVGRFPLDTKARLWQGLSADERDEVWRTYWRLVRQLAESGAFDIVGHLDLPKKYGYRPTVDLATEAEAALDAIAKADMAIELNTSGWDRPAREAYPSPSLLRSAQRRGIPVLISADAHAPHEITRHFAAAEVLARQAGYTELVRYAGRERIPIRLSPAGPAEDAR